MFDVKRATSVFHPHAAINALNLSPVLSDARANQFVFQTTLIRVISRRLGELPMPPLPDNVLASILTSPNEAEPFLTRVHRTIAGGRAEARPVADIFSNTAWGTIRWDRSVGWPNAPRMADGFSFSFNYIEIKDDQGVDPSGKVTGKGTPKPGPPPLVWDGPHDEQNFRVSFLYFAIKSSMQQVLVELKNGVAWHPLWLPPARYLEYPPSLLPFGFFQRKVDDTVFLDELVVRNTFDARQTWDGP